MNVEQFTLNVSWYCAITSASVTSWLRTAHRNRLVDGVPHSAHLVGLAVDVIYDQGLAPEERREWAERLGLKLIAEGDHDHLQPLDWRAG